MKTMTKQEYDEFIKIHKDEDQYAIFIEGKDEPEKIFWAKSREEALNELNKFKETNPTIKCYYKLYNYYVVHNKENTAVKLVYNIVDLLQKNISKSIFSKMYDIYLDMYYICCRKIDKIQYFIKDLVYWVKNYSCYNCSSHNRIEWYSLQSHIINDIKFNVKKLIENMHGCPQIMIDEAKTYFKDKTFKNDVEAGAKLWKIKLTEFLDLVYLYELYYYYGINSGTNDEYENKIFEQYEDTIPYYPESKDINYSECHKLRNEYWDKICEWLKNYGQELWD